MDLRKKMADHILFNRGRNALFLSRYNEKGIVVGPTSSRLRAYQLTVAFSDFIGPPNRLFTAVRAYLRLWAFLPWA